MAELALAGFIGTSLLQAGQKISAGSIAGGEAKIAAKQEELGAIQREGDRKSRLAEALASQIAGAGAKGIAAFEGSPLTILEEDIKTEERATERDILESRLKSIALKARGKVTRKQATAGALIGLVKDIGLAAAVAPTGSAAASGSKMAVGGQTGLFSQVPLA